MYPTANPIIAALGDSSIEEHLEMLSGVIETQNDVTAVELEPELILQVIAERTQSITGADGGTIELVEDGETVCRAGTGSSAPCVGQRNAPSPGISLTILQTGTPIYCPDIRFDNRFSREIARRTAAMSLMAVPVMHLDRPIGVLKVSSRRLRAFTASHLKAMQLMAGMLTASLTSAAELQIKKQLLAERRESEERFRSAFDHAAIGMALVALDGSWLQVNETVCRIVGYSAEELLATDFQSITHPDDLDADLAHALQLVAGQIPDYKMVKRYLHKQGDIVWILLSVSLVRDDAGVPLYFISQIQDITEQTLAGWFEEDRGAVLEMAARGEPLQTTLTRIAVAVCRQMGGFTAVISLERGKCTPYDTNLPPLLRAALTQWTPAVFDAIAQHAVASSEGCSVTRIDSHEIWVGRNSEAIDSCIASCCAMPIRATDGTLHGLVLLFRTDDYRPTPRELRILSNATQISLICIEGHLAKRHLAHLVGHDALTGLPNRRTLDERLRQALAMSRRSGNFAVVMVLDIDHFKAINDTLGHDAGDDLLRNFANRLRALLRETDTLARTGGDEFVVVLPEVDRVDRAGVVGRKLVNGLVEPFELADGKRISATCSIGIALAPRDGDDADTVRKNADMALYRAKQQGRNCYAF
jgi:diguanylate cyclase (GGDEF)-like protein/PAS domain S-box-containing protein